MYAKDFDIFIGMAYEVFKGLYKNTKAIQKDAKKKAIRKQLEDKRTA